MRKTNRPLIACGLALGLVLLAVTPVWGSMFGEENMTLAQMLAQLLQIQKEMSDLNQVASEIADYSQELISAYQRVNAGIDQLKNYSLDAFARDLQTDVYRQYPGFAKLEHASASLGQWEQTRVSSPATAYQAITAVVGDVSKPLRRDIAAGNNNVDEALILAGEASGGLAAAHTAEEVTEKFDNEITRLADLSRNASPGQAAQISARANLLVAAQQSYVMRLLARAVRLHSVDASLEYGERIHAQNAAYEQRDLTTKFAAAATHAPSLIDFSSNDQPIDPYAGESR
jgi:hypothetical protein